MDIRETIINIRDTNGLSQQAFAEMLEVSRTTVARWESGKSIPSSAQIMKICQVFHLDSNELFAMTANSQIPEESDGDTENSGDLSFETNDEGKKFPALFVLFGALLFIATVGLVITIYYAVKDAMYDSSVSVWIMTIPQNTPMIVLSVLLVVFIALIAGVLFYFIRRKNK